MKKMLCIGLLLSASLFSQSLKVSFDWASFEYDQQTAYVEFYYGFPAAALQYTEQEGRLKGLTMGSIRLFQGSSAVKEYHWKTETVGEEVQWVIDKVGVVVPYGSYEGEFVLRDLNRPTSRDSLRFTLHVPAPTFGKARLSELQLSSGISQSAESGSPFYKNGLIVMPHPSLIYSFDQAALFFYAEAYNLPAAAKDGYRLHYRAIGGDGASTELPQKTIVKKNIVNPSVEFGMLNVGKLESGTYRLIVELQTLQGDLIASRERTFYVIQADSQQARAAETPFEESLFAAMDSADVELEYQMIFYLLSKEEQLVHKQIGDLPGKRRFVYSLWSKRYPQFPVSANPARE